MMRNFQVPFLAVCLVLGHGAVAHEVRPAMLEIRQSGKDAFAITWKRPMMGDLGIHLAPHLSNGWLDHAPADQYAAGSFLIETWHLTHAAPGALEHVTLRIEGLQGTITDVLVREVFLDGRQAAYVLRGERPDVILGNAGEQVTRWGFLELGIRHILNGPDHLLFVLGLLMISPSGWALARTISGFTLAHSITLAIATLWRLNLPVSLLNMLIALSILFLALELVRARRCGTSLTLRRPMVPAFLFGLLHGCGFATGLSALDLDRASLVQALLAFNLGVEIAQLAFVGLVLALLRAFRLMEIRWPEPATLAPTYAIGIAGAAWMFQYAEAILQGQP